MIDIEYRTVSLFWKMCLAYCERSCEKFDEKFSLVQVAGTDVVVQKCFLYKNKNHMKQILE